MATYMLRLPSASQRSTSASAPNGLTTSSAISAVTPSATCSGKSGARENKHAPSGTM